MPEVLKTAAEGAVVDGFVQAYRSLIPEFPVQLSRCHLSVAAAVAVAVAGGPQSLVQARECELDFRHARADLMTAFARMARATL